MSHKKKNCDDLAISIGNGNGNNSPICCPEPSALLVNGMVLDPRTGTNLVVSPAHVAPITVFFPANPVDGEHFTVTDCFLRLNGPANRITIDGNGNLICRTESFLQPTPQFPWDGAYPLLPSNATFYLRYIEFKFCAVVGVWCCSCQAIEMPCPICPEPA